MNENYDVVVVGAGAAGLSGAVALASSRPRCGSASTPWAPTSSPTPPARPSSPGVWVAGNLANIQAQVITSAAAGLTAGAAINLDLVLSEAGRAAGT